MISLKITQAQRLFFDRPHVLNRIEEARVRALSKAGAYVMKAARGMLRTARGKSVNKPSKPGRPPKSRTGLLRDHIYFVFDPQTLSVVVGPARLNRTLGAPALHEFGGVRFRRDAIGKSQRLKYPPRPYMRPALGKSLPKLPEAFRNAVRTNVR